MHGGILDGSDLTIYDFFMQQMNTSTTAASLAQLTVHCSVHDYGRKQAETERNQYISRTHSKQLLKVTPAGQGAQQSAHPRPAELDQGLVMDRPARRAI